MLRRFIVFWYGQSMMDAVDRCGVRHDIAMYVVPEMRDHNRDLFVVDLRAEGVPETLILALEAGLYVYDKTPAQFRHLWRKSI